MITDGQRPVFHLSSRVGWMNDPNGFSVYEGFYHLFYQYHPYEARWGPMHWGHAVSRDMLHWEYRPAALAPDRSYDNLGCFSGTAITTKDGKHLLMYTGVTDRCCEAGSGETYQQQCIAVGDGFDYVKYAFNPVISTGQIPERYNKCHFRDPKVWQGDDGIYRVLVAAMDDNGLGNILLYTSDDGINWTYKKVFARNDGSFGKMWECPDFFVLEGKGVLTVSLEDMTPKGYEYHGGHETLCLIGDYDESTDDFFIRSDQSLDHGIDFYAPESIETDDGRRVMIGWMQSWENASCHDIHDPYFGQMSIPRELKIRDCRLYQQPIRELTGLRSRNTVHSNIIMEDDEISFFDVSGRVLEIDLEIAPVPGESLFDRFIMSFAGDKVYHTDLVFRPGDLMVEIDREFFGSGKKNGNRMVARITNNDGFFKAKIILDRFSVEVFLEDGHQVMTSTVCTPLDAGSIVFKAVGKLMMNLIKYDLKS